MNLGLLKDLDVLIDQRQEQILQKLSEPVGNDKQKLVVKLELLEKYCASLARIIEYADKNQDEFVEMARRSGVSLSTIQGNATTFVADMLDAIKLSME